MKYCVLNAYNKINLQTIIKMGRKKKNELLENESFCDLNNDIKDNKICGYKVNIKCKNKKQKELIHAIENNKIIFVEGVFGVGKTYVINSVALKMLKEIDNGIDKIILIMPTLEVGQMHMGMLPGTLEEKLSAHALNELDSFRKILRNNENLNSLSIVDNLIKKGLIEIRPISYLRGASLDNAFICVSEAEEFTRDELFMIISRYESGKMVISGDPLQSCRNQVKNGDSGLLHAIERLSNIDGVGIVKFNETDVVRNDILMDIYKEWK